MFFVNQDYLYGKNKYYADKYTLHGSSDRMDLPQTVVERSQADGSDEGVKQLAGMALKAGGAAAALGGRLAKKTSDYLKSDDAKEKMNAAKGKAQALASGAGAAFAGLKGKAAAFAAERKKSSDEKISMADEYDTEENYDVSSDETVYQSDEDYSYEAPDQIADDDTSYEYETNTSVPAAPMNTSSVYNAGTYSYNNEKKYPIIYILIGVISVLLIVLGVLFGMLLMKNKNEKNDKSNIKATNTSSTDNTSTTEETITTSLDTSSENETQPQTETASQQEAIPSEEQIMQAVQKAMYAHLDAEFNKEKTTDYYYFDRDVKYVLYDINADGIDELFISYHNVESTGSDLYIYKNGEYIKIHNFYTGADICLSEQLLRENIYGGGEMTKIYVISDNEILQKDELKQLSGTKFYHNDFVISESEYNQLKSTYDSMNWIYVPDNSRAFSDLIDMSAYNQNNTVSSDPYADIKQEIINSVDNEDYSGKNSHIENAPSDMVFYDSGNCSSLNITNPIVYEGPDTNYSQISVYESNFYLVGENDNWYYVQWYEGFGRFSHPCYGYTSKSGQSKKYTTYDTSAAGNDFSFFNEPYSRKVITESDPLNLRTAPSVSAEIIIKMPKGSFVTLYGSNSSSLFAGLDDNSEWSYISYTENGITYYGYASSKFIGVP